MCVYAHVGICTLMKYYLPFICIYSDIVHMDSMDYVWDAGAQRLAKKQEYLDNTRAHLGKLYDDTTHNDDLNDENRTSCIDNLHGSKVVSKFALSHQTVFTNFSDGCKRKKEIKKMMAHIKAAEPYGTDVNVEKDNSRVRDSYQQQAVILHEQQTNFLESLGKEVQKVSDEGQTVTNTSDFPIHLAQAPGGSGKTFMMNHFAVKNPHIKVVFSAYTGNAASKQLHGTTLHGFCPLSNKENQETDPQHKQKELYKVYPGAEKFGKYAQLRQQHQGVQVFVIDEVIFPTLHGCVNLLHLFDLVGYLKFKVMSDFFPSLVVGLDDIAGDVGDSRPTT